MIEVVNDFNLLEISLEDDDVEVVEALLILKERCGKGRDLGGMWEVSGFTAVSLRIFPDMFAVDNVGPVLGILDIVDNVFFGVPWNDLSVEEHDSIEIEIFDDLCVVNIVEPIFWYFVLGRSVS